MAYRFDDDFIEAFRNGGCFIFEGEEDKAPGPEEASDKQPDETSDSTEPSTEETPAEDNQETEPPPAEPPQQDNPAVASSEEASAETVNTDADADNGVKPTAQKLANDFMSAGNLRVVARKALHDLGITNPNQKVKVEKLLPYITKAVEGFATKSSDNYTAADITRAILILANSCTQSSVDKAKKAAADKAKAAQKQAQPQPNAPEPKPTGGDGGAEQQPQGKPEEPPTPDDVNAT